MSDADPAQPAPWKPVFAALVEDTVAALRRGQEDLLGHYWALGELTARFSTEADAGKLGPLTLRAFAEGLRDRGQDVSVTQLTQAKRIFDRYRREDLPALIGKGFTVSHLKALLPLPDQVREAVEAKVVDDSGRISSTRAVQQAVRAAKVESLAEIPEPEDALAAAPRAARTASAPQAIASAADDGGPLLATPVAGADTPRIGLVEVREYSRPPLATVRRAAAAAEALADVLPALWTTLAEVEKVGWESDTQAKNFRAQADLLITAFNGLQQVAPTALQRLNAALR